MPLPLTGPYYWFPRPADERLTWEILTGHDAGLDPDAGHIDLWPWVLVQLAAAWGKETRVLKRRLGLLYTGLPRGRVTLPGKRFLILHGNDVRIPGWENVVRERFHLNHHEVKLLFDEHETMIRGHPEALCTILNIPPLSRKP